MSFKASRLSTLALVFIAAVNSASAATSPSPLATCSPDSNYFDRANCPNGCQCFSNFGGAAPVCMYSFDYSKPCQQDSDCLQYGAYYPYCFTARFTMTPGKGYCGSNDPNNWYGAQNVQCAGGKVEPSSSAGTVTSTSSLVSSSSLMNYPSTSSSATPVSSSSSSATSTTSTVSSSASVSPSPSSVSNTLTCDGKNAGSTFSYKTSKATYDITCGADYPGGDVKFLWADSFDACVSACDEESGCLTVAFRSGACYLKNQLTVTSSDAGIWAAKKHDADATAKAEATASGPTCVDKASDATSYKTASGKSFKIVCGKEYGGGDLAFASTASFKECIETCSTTSECVDVSYVNGACYLKRSKSVLIEAGHVWTAEAIDLTSTASTSSSIPTSSPIAGMDLTCADGKDDKKTFTAANGGSFIVECGVDYGGNDLKAVDSTSFADCMNSCDSTDGCVDVSYVWGRCYMKNAATSSSQAGHVWTGRKTTAGPSDSELLSSLQQDGGSFCTAYIGYKAPVTTKITTTTPGASTVLSIQTERSTLTRLYTAYTTATAVQTLPMLQPRQAVATPSIVSQLPASRISSICSLVATGTSTVVSTATASVAPVTQVSIFTSVIPVTKTTVATAIVSSTTRALNPTAYVNLDFETGDAYNWNSLGSNPLWTNSIVSPGHSRDGVTSNYAAQISRDAGTVSGYAFSRYDQRVPNMVAGQTYRWEFSFKYSTDVPDGAQDNCEFTVGLWSVGLAGLIPSTSSPRLKNQNYIASLPKCGTSTDFRTAIQPPQQPGEWRRYSGYYRAPNYVQDYTKMIWIGLQCRGAAYTSKQTIWFDDVVIAPEAAFS
ncbi:hypothetical protein E8E12_008323 [Didymella heteroderae]|uniref:Apple domain-containing protein n=1 Tax=Didymella heteroderae TaxID=1769908 RepID=A0A9P4WUV6_9PLEO|nr:hypothetical protein E8E12_008323 [Didymella heteroderae]